MKKTIQINIAGIVFHIEEDAYQTLNTYLESIQKYFSTYEGSGEIVADIEARIAEKFIGKNKPDALPVITATDVDQIMQSMGGVTDFEAIEDGTDFAFDQSEPKSKSQPNQQNAAQKKETKRLYRDTKRKAVGGVLAGLANYFNTDVVWFRILFLVGFFSLSPTTNSGLSGVLFIAYIICWIAFPANDALEDTVNIKKFYRDSERKVVGGVASGLAKFLDIDVAILRIIFVVLIPFFGIGFLAYIIMWIASPMAQTLTQKMEMKGEAVTLENINSNIKQNISDSSEGKQQLKNESTLATLLLLPFKIIGGVFQTIGRVLSHLGPILRVFLGLILCILGLALTIGAISGTAVFYGLLSDHNWFTIDRNLGIFTRDLPLSSGVFLFLTIAIPAVGTLLSGVILISNDRLGSKNFWLTGLGLWVIGLVGLATIGGKYSMNYAKKASLHETVNYQAGLDILYLETKENLDNDTYSYDLRIRIEPTNADVVSIEKEIISYGITREAAREHASKLTYQVNQKDSILVFDKRPVLDADASFRNQKMNVVLKIPKGKKVHMSRNFANHLLANSWQLRNKYGIDFGDIDKLLFTMNNEGELVCEDCEVLNESEQEAFAQRDNQWSDYYLNDDDFKPRGDQHRSFDLKDFDAIDVSSIFHVLVTQGDEYKVEFITEDMKDLEDLNVTVRNGTLNIDFKDRFFKNRARINAFITLPRLKSIETSGAAKMKVIDFKNIDKLDVDMAGASNLQLDIEAKKVDLEGSGASKIEIRGNVHELDLELSGASKFIGKEAEIDQAAVNASGASHARFGRVNDIHTNTSGASSVKRD